MGLFVTAHSSQPFCIHAIRAKFTADRIKNSTEGRREKKNLVEDSFQTAKKKKRKPEIIGACAEWGGTKPFYTEGSQDNGCMSQGYSGLHC